MSGSLSERLAGAGAVVLGGIFFLAMILLPVLLIVGGIRVAEVALPWMFPVCALIFWLDVLVLLPLAIFPATRIWAGVGLIWSSYAFGATAWFMGLLTTWILWGGVAVVVGLFILGVGVVPIGLLALLVNGEWGAFGLLLGAIVLTFATRAGGAALGEA